MSKGLAPKVSIKGSNREGVHVQVRTSRRDQKQCVHNDYRWKPLRAPPTNQVSSSTMPQVTLSKERRMIQNPKLLVANSNDRLTKRLSWRPYFPKLHPHCTTFVIYSSYPHFLDLRPLSFRIGTVSFISSSAWLQLLKSPPIVLSGRYLILLSSAVICAWCSLGSGPCSGFVNWNQCFCRIVPS